MANLCIIPARGGSKRIPRKNIKDFLGKPIIAYSIQTALDSNLFDEVMVSTDDEEIAEIGIKYGANVPFLRSAESSNDYASTADVLLEVLHNYAEMNKEYSAACCIYPASPLISVQSLSDSFKLLVANKVDSAFPVCQFSYPIWRALNLNNENKIGMIWPENESKRSQDLPSAFHDAGQFYWFTTKKFIDTPHILTGNSGAIVLDELHVQDIDSITDWKIAEIKYKLIHNIE